MDKLFVKVGDDRIRLSEIKNYGIKNGVRYLVKNASMAQTDRYTFEIISYYDPESQDSPMYDIHECPIKIDGRVVRLGSLSEDEYIIENSRILYINGYEYHEKSVDFDIDEKLAELDKLLL